jgi:hypothetical protein
MGLDGDAKITSLEGGATAAVALEGVVVEGPSPTGGQTWAQLVGTWAQLVGTWAAL